MVYTHRNSLLLFCKEKNCDSKDSWIITCNFETLKTMWIRYLIEKLIQKQHVALIFAQDCIL